MFTTNYPIPILSYREKVERKFLKLHERARYKYGGEYEEDGKHIIMFALFWNEKQVAHVYMKNNILYPYFKNSNLEM